MQMTIIIFCFLIVLTGCGAANENLSGTANIPPQESGDASLPDSSSNGQSQEEMTDFNDQKDPEIPTDRVPMENGTPINTIVSSTDADSAEMIPPVQSGSTATQTPPTSTSQAPIISPITMLEPGLSSASFSGDDGFDAFLANGGASSDAEAAQFLAARLAASIDINSGSFGCSTLAVTSPDGHTLFGRNFDWQNCEALILTSKPSNGYASISTVNLGFITQVGGSLNEMVSQENIRVLAALYAPLDGMNEKGLAVSVNMIQDSAAINQNTEKPDLTTTTAVRLLLNKAASVDEALELLEQYDLHGSMGMMIHFALADTAGRSVVVEYINNQMVVTDTPAVTNFYLAEGEKHGIGTQQSHTRYDILIQALANHPAMTMADVRDALDSVSKDNFNEFESTEWSAVFNLSTGEAHYYHRETYDNRFTFSIG